MKRSSAIGVAVLVVIACIVFIAMPRDKDQGTLKIAALLPLTGPGANYGRWERQRIEIAVDEINEAGGVASRKLVVVYEDIKSDPGIAATAFRKQISVDDVPAVVAGISSAVLAMAPIADQEHVVLLNCGGISPKIPEVTGDYVFSAIVDGSVEVKAMAKYLRDKGYTKAATLCIKQAAGIDAKDRFQAEFKQLGGKIVADEYHDEEATDFRSQLANLARSGADAIYLASFTRESGRILKQAGEMGFGIPWFSYAPFEGQDVIDTAGTAAEGVIYTYAAYDPNSPDQHVRRFQQEYKARFNEEAGIYAATFYDGIHLIVRAAENAGLTGEGIRDGLREIENYAGAAGRMEWDQRQVAKKPIQFKIVRNGRFDVLTSED